jgi:transposase-like protein
VHKGGKEIAAMTVDLTAPIFHNDDAARAHMESIRWPHGPFCPHCGAIEGITRLAGESHRKGLHQCNGCRGHFSVLNASVMESSHIPLPKWVLAFHLMAASKKGVSAKQVERMLGLSYKTAWFMCHRIREAMSDSNPTPIGGEGKIIEADEAYHGRKETPVPSAQRQGRPYLKRKLKDQKRPILALVERGGEVRVKHVNYASGAAVRDFLVKNASRKSRLMTDESRLYLVVGKEFATHETLNHSAGEYARDDVTTNSVEGFFGVFKRGMLGVYQHCGEQHFQRTNSLFGATIAANWALRIPSGRRLRSKARKARG